MSELFNKSYETLKQGFDSLKNIKKDKREYKEYLARVKSLPTDYRNVFEKMTRYMWSLSGSGDGYDMLALQAGLLELFEAGVAEGKQVLDVTGEDVAAFSDELLRSAKTWTEDRREALNRDIKKNLEK